MIKFIVLAYTGGPMAALSYGMGTLSMTPLEALLSVSFLSMILIPIFFKVFEYGGKHRELYRIKIFRKASEASNEKTEAIRAQGDRLIHLFEERLGHLGFYFAIVLFTMVFGVLWASLLSYILLVKRKRAIACMIAGIFAGNLFWLYLTYEAMDYATPVQLIAIALVVPVIVYGSKREMKVIREVAKHMRLGKHRV